MTLLLATVTEHDILVTADGLSCATNLRDAPGRATLQKIFPVPSHPVAFAQCGPNFLKVSTGKTSLDRWLASFLQELEAIDVVSIAQRAWKGIQSDEVEENERKQFFARSAYLWVMGYSAGGTDPEFVCVSRQGVRNLLDGETLPFSKSVGAGADLLKECEWPNHDDAWLKAMKAQEKRDKPVFGGHMHRLRITPARCGWEGSHKPMRGTLGLEMTQKKWGVAPTTEANFNNPRGEILSLRKTLVDNLCRRALMPNGKHPKTYGGAQEHWSVQTKPNWDLTDQLVADCDDAELADPADVSQDDARLYDALVQQVITSLPPIMQPPR